MRLKSIKNIGKITKSMKMIASTKLNRAQKAMEIGRTFGETAAGNKLNDKSNQIKTNLYFTFLFIAITNYIEVDSVKKTPSSQLLLIACSSDKGLCGAIHSSVSKFTKRLVNELPEGNSAEIIVLGDKSKPQIARGCRKQIVLSVNQIGKDVPTFTDASAIAQLIMAQQAKSAAMDPEIKLISNKFMSLIAYETRSTPIYSPKDIMNAPKLTAYECEESTIESFSQFLFASQIYRALVEGHAAEMSAKRMAMENASKNSDEIVINLTMKYNRTRQTVITNELVDIITGASAL